ncbi:hypothetical protein A3A79_00285 [Candidatus Gottesmanbacteria bacterium RIFCSPLOWO2_01_FULL_43_11b]|uniref:Mannosyl-glycoprotein endo-beta-N-acetylglucosamidase-like domain-containing protein n=1 Tax=Candidatus Gottesmanbacteria bacterium RIFCSPLOWO2_01_FULL_43_11b TaxID=1798392 RepID=A0A1F6AGV4_9BACT|nr:MAG: hypothetical protein A3A79_00285 [Candidatus Gottesmanbacteria bacterium RIFCSPLOWO2_01_FULL_43_11b]
MIRKLLVISFWFPIVLVLLIINLGLLIDTVNRNSEEVVASVSSEQTHFQVASSANGTGMVLGTSVEGADARSILLETFLREHKSPMAPYANYIVEKSDENGIDFRLVVAIAMCESNAGKHMPKRNEFNAWGIGVYTGQLTGAGFDSWPHAIDWVTTYIRENYYDEGLIDLREIGAKWAPPSVENGYSWTNCVEEFQGSIL